MPHTPYGYIVHDHNDTIYGIGLSPESARLDALDTLDIAGITIVPDGDMPTVYGGYWMWATDLRTRPATAALIRAVVERGGSISWALDDSGIATLHE